MALHNRFKALTAGLLAGVLVWSYSALAAGHGGAPESHRIRPAGASTGAGRSAANGQRVAGTHPVIGNILPPDPVGAAAAQRTSAKHRSSDRPSDPLTPAPPGRDHGTRTPSAKAGGHERARAEAQASAERRVKANQASAKPSRAAQEQRPSRTQRASSKAAPKAERSHPGSSEPKRREAVRQAEESGGQKARSEQARVTSGSMTEPDLDDLQLLARLVTIEAGNEPYQGQVAVAAVVLNRVRHRQFPGSVRAVIFAPGQFPAAAQMIHRVKPRSTAVQAAREALAGRDPSKGALFFYNPQHHPCNEGQRDFFCSLDVTARIGHHVFAR